MVKQVHEKHNKHQKSDDSRSHWHENDKENNLESIIIDDFDNASHDNMTEDDYLSETNVKILNKVEDSDSEEESYETQNDYEMEMCDLQEEEMWDDDSDEYWDPSVRDVTWSVTSPCIFPCHNPTKVNTSPLPVEEGQFDDSAEDIS